MTGSDFKAEFLENEVCLWAVAQLYILELDLARPGPRLISFEGICGVVALLGRTLQRQDVLKVEHVAPEIIEFVVN